MWFTTFSPQQSDNDDDFWGPFQQRQQQQQPDIRHRFAFHNPLDQEDYWQEQQQQQHHHQQQHQQQTIQSDGTAWGLLKSVFWQCLKSVGMEVLVAGGTYLFAQSVSNWLSRNNRSLSEQQKSTLYRLISNAVDEARQGRDVTNHLLGILSIALPDDGQGQQDIGQIASDILTGAGNNMDSFFTYSFNFGDLSGGRTEEQRPYVSPEEQARRQLPPEIEFNTLKPADGNSDILQEEYGLDQRVLKIPQTLRQVLIDTLKTSPQCPISLDDILEEDGTVRQGITSVFQYVGGKPHCFLYDSVILDEWVSRGNSQNPVTRQAMKQKEYFVLTDQE